MERMTKEKKVHLEGAKAYGPQDYEVVDEMKILKEENKKLKERVDELEKCNLNLQERLDRKEEVNKKMREEIKDHQLYEEKLEHRIIEFEELLHGE